MSAAAAWGIEAIVASTVLMILVLVVRTPVRRAFGPDVGYALWALPVLRLLLPPLPHVWREAAVAPVLRASETITIYITEPLGAASAAPTVSGLPVGACVAALWVIGAAAFLVWHALAHRRFCRRLLAAQVRGCDVAGGIRLIETDAASGPLAFGILRRYVAFPGDFVARYDQEERDLALAHELGHHARGDLLANWIALGVLAVHWFNPIAWRAFRAFRADQEIATDARVLAGLKPIARHAYACAIVKSAHGGPVSAACHLHTVNDLKGRLKMLTTTRISRRRLASGAAAVATLAVAGLGLTASGTLAAETVRQRVEATTGLSLPTEIVAPLPPAAATVPVPPTPLVPTHVKLMRHVDSPALPTRSDLPKPPLPPAPPASVSPGSASREVTTTTTIDDTGKAIRHIKVVARGRDGAMQTQEWDGTDAIPTVTAQNCSGGSSRQLVIEQSNGDKRNVIICTNRVRAVAAHEAAVAVNSVAIQRNAMRSALASMRVARARIDRNPNMTAEQRREALAGIDEALAEVRADAAGQD